MGNQRAGPGLARRSAGQWYDLFVHLLSPLTEKLIAKEPGAEILDLVLLPGTFVGIRPNFHTDLL